jgi:oligopeptide transport system substrate-binding protein
VGRFSWTADYNHPHSFLETLLSYSPQNWSRWKSPQFDQLVEAAAATADPAASIARYRQAEKIAVDAMPLVPLYFYTKSTMVKPYVKGFYENAKNEHLVRFMWLDRDWKRQAVNTPAYPIAEFAPPGRY